ncbi:odorant receptor 94a-like [Culicoides brevitarsis]|uniref:odorant receptor 94a-like n=1 Tax=Culicoides brevitarsis TaxID=469753 RepID=UPI00307B8191
MVINIINVWLIWGSAFESICFCLVTWMLGWTSLMLIYTILNNKLVFCDLLKLMYENGSTLDIQSEQQEIDKYIKHSKMCKNLIVFTTFLCAGGGLVCTFYPVVIYFFTGEAVLPYGFFIPGVSTTSNPGYLINYAYQAFQCFLTVLGTMQSTFHIYLLFSSNTFYQMDNLIIKLRKLSAAIESNPNMRGHEEQIIQIIKIHNRMKTYMSTVDGAFNKMFFLNIASYSIMNAMTLFVLVTKFWFIGYYLLGVLFGLIFLPCAIGTAIEVKNTALIDAVYEVSWYLLTPKERKTFCLFLMGVQTTQMPTCGGFLPLNINTFRITYSKIYTLLMFLKDTQK